MRALIQRVTGASVSVGDREVTAIASGMLVLVGVTADDGEEDIGWLCRKIVNLRIFSDDAGTMNRSVLDTGGEVLAVSQFTLFASLQRGNRPSYSMAAPQAVAKPLFERFVAELEVELGSAVPTGVFGADMAVALTNDGPVTIWLDSRTRD